jgi:hypothetical protein
MARIAVLCQSPRAGGRWHVRRLPHLVRKLIGDGENEVVLLGERRLETRLGEVAGNLTGRRSFQGICQELSVCDLAICVDEQCYPAVALGQGHGPRAPAAIPIVGLFFGTRHFDVIPSDFDDFTALYPDLNGTLSSISPSLVAERALARLAGEAPPREVLRPPLPRRNCADALWSIIVAAHDRTEDQIESTQRCIEALREHTRVMHEILVVDRESNAQTVSYVKSQGDLRGVFLRGRGSSAEAVRMGAEAASGEVLLFLHNDQYVQEGWEEDYIEALEGGRALVGTQAWKLGPDGVVRALELEEGAFLGFDGAAICRNVLQFAGGFDAAAMTEYAELADLCWRLKELTFEVKLLESPRIRHLGHLTRARVGGEGVMGWSRGAGARGIGGGGGGLGSLLIRWPGKLPYQLESLRDELVVGRRGQLAEAVERAWAPEPQWPSGEEAAEREPGLAVAEVAVAERPAPEPESTEVAASVPAGKPEASAPAIAAACRVGEAAAHVVMVASCGLSSTGGGQRPAQLARAFARHRGEVVYVSDHDHLGREGDIVLASPFEFRDQLAPELREHKGFAIYGLANLRERASALGPSWVQVFDLCDDWEAFAEMGHLVGFNRDQYIDALRTADLVTCSAGNLVKIARKYRARRTLLVRNAGPAEPFSEQQPPRDFLHGKIRVVFIGSLWGKWIDWGAFGRLCEDLAAVGGVVNVVGGEAPGHMRHHRDVRWHGELPYSEAMRYAVASDVGIVPFGAREVCRSVDPIKYYDYAAARCRTVATEVMSELRGRQYCHLARRDRLIHAVRRAMAAGPITWQQAEAFCRANSWEARCAAIMEAVRRL